eukprot:scaffold25921_cov137-Cylindrotheca_fusiformis.AAC.9
MDDPKIEPASDLQGNGSTKSRWLVLMCLGLVVFLLLPLLASKRRRKLCLRRLRERRWIEGTERSDDWYVEAHRRRPENEQQTYRMSRSQEDEILKQLLINKMQEYTILLSSRILKVDIKQNMTKDGAFSLGNPKPIEPVEVQSSQGSVDDGSAVHGNDVENPMHSDIDRESNRADFQDTVGFVCIPLAGNDLASEEFRYVPNGCHICLSPFASEERITWSANVGCSHTFHHECLIQWFLTVGRKTQAKWCRQNPNASEKEVRSKLCQFPMLCPCCRQPFCPKSEGNCEPSNDENGSE